MNPIALSKRMHKIVEFIPNCASLADIGTDHAFIPIHAVQIGRVQRAIAADLRSGPLQKARENVRKHGLTGSIELRLGDGLATLQPGEGEVIVSAGIGGHVHTEMIMSQPEVARSAKCLIFQPMNAGHLLRQRFDELGYHIQAESLVLDDDKVYEVIVVQPKSGLDPAYDPYRQDPTALQLRYTYGPRLTSAPDALFIERLDRDVDKLRSIQKRAGLSSNTGALARIQELQAEVELLSNFRTECIRTLGGNVDE